MLGEKISICSKCLGFSFLPTFKSKQITQTTPPQYALRGYSEFIKMVLGIKYRTSTTRTWFWFLASSLGACPFLPWDTLVIPVAARATSSCHSRHSRQLWSIQVPAQAMAALVVAREVIAGLATLWDAGDGQAWIWESIFIGQKLIELFLKARAPWQSALTSSSGKLQCTPSSSLSFGVTEVLLLN